jgi:hypothetical protein
MGTPPVTGTHQQFGVRAHKRRRHGDSGAIWEHEALAAGTEVLDDAEHVVPAACVQPCRVLPQLVEDFFHFKRCRNGFDQHSGTNGAARNIQPILCPTEHVVPEPSLTMAFQLGKVEVRSAAALQLPTSAVEEVEPKVDETPRYGIAIDKNVQFRKVPAPRPDHDGGQLFTEAIFLAGIGGEVDSPVQGIHQVELTRHDVVPGWRGGILEVG